MSAKEQVTHTTTRHTERVRGKESELQGQSGMTRPSPRPSLPPYRVVPVAGAGVLLQKGVVLAPVLNNVSEGAPVALNVPVVAPEVLP